MTARAAVLDKDDRTPITERITKALDSLPTLPLVALKLGELIHSRNTSMKQVVELLQSDPSLSAKLLRLVNSAYFGIPGGVSDIARAVPFVGFNTLYQLALSISVLQTLTAKGGRRFDPKQLWLHSLTVGTAGKVLAEEAKLADPGSLFTAGLLHDIGKIALAKVDPESFLNAFDLAELEGVPMIEAERRCGLPTHDRLGARLAKQWRFPTSLSSPIELHHDIERPEVRGRLALAQRRPAEAIALSDLLAHRIAKATGAPTDDGEQPDGVVAMLEDLGVSERRLEGYRDKTLKALDNSRAFIQLIESMT
ncbi:MAG: HDOD domain-containing protein [Kofleriaceae bacterium]|jgi:putative nucleotidyltransferase with HDIG domain|nr:HDOD domain-containing protein [Kofleriaceae bacterium]MBP6841583.1 HDOD domain-containing protein [Kofleriaceae bacterium]MBP9208295.1 HDOD domain-containing protein [Kofleriaceae bacterium]